jgi:hypothetical protein
MCSRWKRCAWILAALLWLSSPSYAQTSLSDTTAVIVSAPKYTRAFGVRVGNGAITKDRAYTVLNAFYDIPIGHIVFSPELKFFLADPIAFGMETRFKFGLWQTNLLRASGSISTEVEVWENRMSIGLPVSLLFDLPISDWLEFELMGTASPMLFLGVNGRAIFFGIFAGVRIPVGN